MQKEIEDRVITVQQKAAKQVSQFPNQSNRADFLNAAVVTQ